MISSPTFQPYFAPWGRTRTTVVSCSSNPKGCSWGSSATSSFTIIFSMTSSSGEGFLTTVHVPNLSTSCTIRGSKRCIGLTISKSNFRDWRRNQYAQVQKQQIPINRMSQMYQPAGKSMLRVKPSSSCFGGAAAVVVTVVVVIGIRTGKGCSNGEHTRSSQSVPQQYSFSLPPHTVLHITGKSAGQRALPRWTKEQQAHVSISTWHRVPSMHSRI
mmetsp:Transcript_32057/g.75192  ORF Transcript_32057/g.75192 Transcript_32057/m.75192 type:complete len:215 (-) Transcript_32057:1087-1731(-)